jgi:hypothetical protein
MAEGVAADVKAAAKALKTHYIAFLVGAAVIMVLGLWYEHKNPGAITTKLAKIPGVGKLFA